MWYKPVNFGARKGRYPEYAVVSGRDARRANYVRTCPGHGRDPHLRDSQNYYAYENNTKLLQKHKLQHASKLLQKSTKIYSTNALPLLVYDLIVKQFYMHQEWTTPEVSRETDILFTTERERVLC